MTRAWAWGLIVVFRQTPPPPDLPSAGGLPKGMPVPGPDAPRSAMDDGVSALLLVIGFACCFAVLLLVSSIP